MELGNLSSHRHAIIIQLLMVARGARVEILPLYSPDLNPIEKFWAKVKAHLRKA